MCVYLSFQYMILGMPMTPNTSTTSVLASSSMSVISDWKYLLLCSKAVVLGISKFNILYEKLENRYIIYIYGQYRKFKPVLIFEIKLSNFSKSYLTETVHRVWYCNYYKWSKIQSWSNFWEELIAKYQSFFKSIRKSFMST